MTARKLGLAASLIFALAAPSAQAQQPRVPAGHGYGSYGFGDGYGGYGVATAGYGVARGFGNFGLPGNYPGPGGNALSGFGTRSAANPDVGIRSRQTSNNVGGLMNTITRNTRAGNGQGSSPMTPRGRRGR